MPLRKVPCPGCDGFMRSDSKMCRDCKPTYARTEEMNEKMSKATLDKPKNRDGRVGGKGEGKYGSRSRNRCGGELFKESRPRNPSMVVKRLACVHCGNMVVYLKPRNLCLTCYYTPEVRIQHPTTESQKQILVRWKEAEQKRVAESGSLHEPTRYLPGEEGKIKVMEDRAAKGLPLFHPLDGLHQE